MFSKKWLYHFTFPLAMSEWSSFSIFLPAFSVITKFYVLFIYDFYFSHLMSIYWCFIAVLICVFLMTNDVEQLFMCLFTSYISSAVKCQFNSLCPIELFTLLCFVLFFNCQVQRGFYIFWIQVLCQICDLQIFSPSP